jgi:Family of unknown function (DUF6445)
MSYDFASSQPLSIETCYAGRERQPVLIIDNYLRNPEALVNYAANEARFLESPAMYPGIIAPLPDAYCESLLNVLGPKIGETFDVKPETAFLNNCFFAITTFPPEQLHYRQRLPHVDDYGPGVIAALHYLCDSTQGGTALFRHRATGFESVTREQHEHMQSLIVQDIASQGPLPPEYVGANNRFFEQTLCMEARFNRLVIYRGSVLHSMLVDANTQLDPNPRVGRLTINTFLAFESA